VATSSLNIIKHLSFSICLYFTILRNRFSQTIVDNRFNDSATARLKADDEDRVEWAPARMNGQEGVALRNESPQLSAQLFAPEDVPKAAVNLICLAGDVAGRKTISEIANRRKRRRGKIALS